MHSVTGEKMRKIDKYCIENLGIPAIVLMENAALKVLDHLHTDKLKKYIIVASIGNNGGDGLAVARHLITMDKKVKVFILGSLNKTSKCFGINYNILKNMKANIEVIKNKKNINNLKKEIKQGDMVIDSIFGTGLSKSIKGEYKETIKVINKYSKHTLSIDIPSGLNCDTGEIYDICIKANETVTLQLNKKGFLNPNAKDYTGEVIIETIGMPSNVVNIF
ncbi:MAG: NAD(P)H-hydrate epimerase [Firmicutes bacterium]|nr:NAD(P)H-hydrate epimerase [Bacillota bacterium]